MTGAADVPPMRRSICHSDSSPMPDTNSWFSARTRRSSLNSPGGVAGTGRSVGRAMRIWLRPDRMAQLKVTSADELKALPIEGFVKQAVALNGDKGDPTKRK